MPQLSLSGLVGTRQYGFAMHGLHQKSWTREQEYTAQDREWLCLANLELANRIWYPCTTVLDGVYIGN
jgi:hypothetical protein